MTRKQLRDEKGQYAGSIGDGKTPPQSGSFRRPIADRENSDPSAPVNNTWKIYEKTVPEILLEKEVDRLASLRDSGPVAADIIALVRQHDEEQAFSGEEPGEWTGLPDFEGTISDFRRFVDHPGYHKKTDILDDNGEKVGEMTVEVSDITGDAATLIRLAFSEKDYRDNRASLRVETKETRTGGFLQVSEVSFQLMYRQHNMTWRGSSEKECFASLYDWLRVNRLQ